MSVSPWSTWAEWLASVDAETRSRAESLRDTFARLGADDPEDWSRSETEENIAQLGRFVFLRAVWREIERWRDRDAVARLAEGASAEAIDLAARMAGQAALDLAISVVQIIDNGQDVEYREPLPGWVLVELDPDGHPTGRLVDGLHESVLETDPRRIEAQDIRGW